MNSNHTFYYLGLSVLFSTALGIIFPDIGMMVEPYLLLWLGLLLLINLLNMNLSELYNEFYHPKNLIILTILKLVLIPVGLFAIMNLLSLTVFPISTNLMLSVFLLSGISTGLGSPFVVNFVGGRLPIVVGLIIITSLSVPFILPILIFLFFSSNFAIPIFDMIGLLLVALMLPLIAGQLLKRIFPKLMDHINKQSLNLSLVLIFLINLGVFAKYSYFFFYNPLATIENIILVFILFGYYGLTGYGISRLMTFSKADRISTMISMIYVNNILIVVFAQQFFGTEIAALAAFFNIPYYMGIILLKKTLRAK
ncbi:MAG TPA: bile acid:sodium symporter [Candidatus Nitrosocosmicus sp.]|nr:bile acid:sodium symporter [Candidatus Nitrosocosmicus sp.]